MQITFGYFYQEMPKLLVHDFGEKLLHAANFATNNRRKVDMNLELELGSKRQ
jgi:hypothetical protein